MPLSPQEEQQLAELEEMDRLEAELNGASASPAASRSPSIEKPRKGALEAGATGVSQGATLGYMPQIVGGIVGGYNKLQDLINPISDGNGGTIPRMGYTEARDRTNKDFEAQQKAHPIAYGAGQIAGSVAPGASAARLTKGLGAIKGGAASGAGLGFLANPGDKEGVVDPLQLKERGINSIIGGSIGGTAGALSKLTSKGAQISDNIRDIESGEMANKAAAAIDDAASQINAKQIAPRSEQLKELIRGKEFTVNPDRVEPVFPHLGAKMAEGVADQPAPARTVLSGDRALRLKRAADAAANYGASKPFDPVATAKSDEAKALADILRRQINADPRAAQLNEGMAKYAALRDALVKREGAAPMAALQSKPGTDFGAVLAQVDNAAKTNLRRLGDDIRQAKDLIVNPEDLKDTAQPLKAIKAYMHLAERGGVEAARRLDKLPVGTKESLVSALTPTKRVKDRKK